MFNISFKSINFPFISEGSGIIILESTGRAGRACCSDTSSCDLCLILSPAQASRSTQGYFCWAEDHCICRIQLQADVESWNAVCKHDESLQQSWLAVSAPPCQDPPWFSINPESPRSGRALTAPRVGCKHLHGSTAAQKSTPAQQHSDWHRTINALPKSRQMPSPDTSLPQLWPVIQNTWPPTPVTVESQTPGIKGLGNAQSLLKPHQVHQSVSKCFL